MDAHSPSGRKRADDGLLLHVCCGPCSTVAVPYWRAEGLRPEALFLNPNVQPPQEYRRRLTAMEEYASAVDLPLHVDNALRAESWARAVGSGWMRGGERPGTAEQRCRACAGLRLVETAWQAAARGLPRFTTSLTLSPYQRHDLIVQAGLHAAAEAGVEFLYADLRRHYGRSLEESRRRALYRQSYCGCAASKWEGWFERAARRRRRRAA